MSEKHDEKKDDSDFDANALAALVGGSVPPPGDEPKKADADDDMKLDLRALAASVAPPAMPADGGNGKDAPATIDVAAGGAAAKAALKEEVIAHEATKPAARTKSSDSTPKAKADKPAEEPRAVPVQPAKSGGGMGIGIVIGLAAAGVLGYFVYTNQQSSAGEEALAAADTEPTSVGPEGASGRSEEGDRAVEHENTAPENPAPQGEGPAAPGVAAEGTANVEGVPAPAVEGAAPAADPGGETHDRAGRRRPRAGGGGAAAPAPAGGGTAAGGAAPATGGGPPPAGGGAAPASGGGAAPAGGGGAAPAGGGGGELDNVLDRALGGRPAEGGTRTVAAGGGAAAGGGQTQARAGGGAAAAPSGDLPDVPSRGDIARTLGGLLPAIRNCAGEQVGLANATILIRNDGNVASVAVGGNPFGGTPQGACMEGVVRRAHFPPFRQTTFRIVYPFSIRAAP